MKDSLRTYVQRSPLNGILFLLLLVFTGASVFSFFGFVISEFFLGIPLLSNPSMLEDMTDPEMIPALRVMQVLQALGMLIIPSGVYLWLTSSVEGLRSMFGTPNRQGVMLSVALFVIAFPFINYLAEWNSNVEIPTALGDWMQGKESQAGKLTELFLDMPSVGLLFFNLIMIALLPAVGEELIFRGIIQRGLHRQFGNAHVAIWVSAALFSAIHLQFFGFIPRMLMGVAMGYLLFWSGNLWYPIIAHLTNNAMSVVLSYGIQHGQINAEIETAGLENGTLASFSLVFCLMLLYLFKQHQTSIQQTR
ncbi:MAG: CPBP family intramembrane metalloprotease [Flavobacteriales bacterium]|nr:CPBP family intramembrane metalloprotease [Flavobacteriales bacterium]MCB9205314.1 CPBP family intramembrane metalloprotease [Flavobacteriales bacterium]